jgi:uncharacterized protein Yka (UPF0111/DUF47 family)
MANNSLTMAEELLALFATGDDPARVQRLDDLEHAGDQLVHAIYVALSRSFVPTLSLKELRPLIDRLDDVADGIEAAGQTFHLYQLGAPTGAAHQFARIIRDQTEALLQAIALLPYPAQAAALRERLISVHRLGENAATVLHQVLAHLYDEATDVQGVITARKWNDVYDQLAATANAAEEVATLLKAIISQRS